MTTSINPNEEANTGKEYPMTTTFAWNDSVAVEKADPMTLVGRYNSLLKHMAAQALEVNPANDGYGIFGLTETVERLAKAGDYDGIGYLLTALESTVADDVRVEWPTI